MSVVLPAAHAKPEQQGVLQSVQPPTLASWIRRGLAFVDAPSKQARREECPAQDAAQVVRCENLMPVLNLTGVVGQQPNPTPTAALVI